MKLISLVGATIVASVQASPAIVWTKGLENSVQRHTSDIVDVHSVISDINSPLSLATVVFVIDRNGDDVNDSLTTLASSGALPQVQAKYDVASMIHHNVAGVQRTDILAKEARKNHANIMELALEDYLKMVENPGAEDKHGRSLSTAGVVFVRASPLKSTELDSAVSRAVENAGIHSVILTAVRSTDEVKHTRNLMARQETENLYQQANSRRLANDDANAAANAQDMTGIYYVPITPNILAGILFSIFFVCISYLAIACMGMITCSDVYAEKYPVIGREA